MTITINNKAHTVLKIERHKLDNNGRIDDYYLAGCGHPVCLTDLFVRAKHFVTIKHFYGDYIRARRVYILLLAAIIAAYFVTSRECIDFGKAFSNIDKIIVPKEILIP